MLNLLAALILAVTPTFAFAPGATFRAKVQVQPQAENRLLVIELDGENYFRSTEFALAGASGPKTTWLDIPNVPPGDYILTAAVIDSVGKIRIAEHREVHVMGGPN
jgi:hypothetical protein